ncbi:MAG: hypothetical protein UHK60_12330 [Acutalibacteraceae bacterium]|nr:hypothetical protein [Acutalibacteraceae bacterium]
MSLIFWLIIFVVVILIIAIAYSRSMNDNYHAGSGMFKNSEYNIDKEEKDISDVEYFNRDGKMK